MKDESNNEQISYEALQQTIFQDLTNRAYDIEVEEQAAENEPELFVQQVTGEAFQIVDEEDREILLQRDAHFGGSFIAMQEHYEKFSGQDMPGYYGVLETISLSRILFLADVERRLGKNLAPKILSGSDAEHVALARTAYERIAQLSNEPFSIPLQLFLDCTNSFGERSLTQEEKDTLRRNPKLLLELAAADQFRDSLFPGFGYAPLRALKWLVEAHVEEALPLCFNLLAVAQEEEEEELFSLIPKFGGEAFEYARRTFLSRPVTPFHEKLMLVLLHFSAIYEKEVKALLIQQVATSDIYHYPTILRWIVVGIGDLDQETRKTAKEKLLAHPLPHEIEQLVHELLM
jgi:hypothetical protein